MSELQELSKDKRLRNHFNIDKKRRTNHHVQSSPHFHSYYEIYYMQEGSCRCFLENTVYNLARGHFLVIHPGEYHIVTYEQKGLHDRYTLYFDDQRLDESMKSYLRHNKEDWLLPRHFMIREEQEPEFLSLLGRMLEFYRMTMGTHYPLSRSFAILAGVTLFVLTFLVAMYPDRLSVKLIGVSILPLLGVMVGSLYTQDKTDFGLFSNLYTGLLYLAVPVSLSNLIVFKGGTFDGSLMLSFFILIWACFWGATARNCSRRFPRRNPGRVSGAAWSWPLSPC